jgi:hypothetical protein
MKNIHIIGTDKPSRLFIGQETGELCLYIKDVIHQKEKQNIYITSDEEITDCNCYVINAVGEMGRRNVFKPIKVTEEIVRKEPLITYPNGGWCKKIILTTDTALISDGVQAIPDEFLEWFVKNPSCEEVEVEKRKLLQGTNFYKIITPQEDFDFDELHYKETFESRQYYIPKEEPKPLKKSL